MPCQLCAFGCISILLPTLHLLHIRRSCRPYVGRSLSRYQHQSQLGPYNYNNTQLSFALSLAQRALVQDSAPAHFQRNGVTTANSKSFVSPKTKQSAFPWAHEIPLLPYTKASNLLTILKNKGGKRQDFHCCSNCIKQPALV